MGLSLHDLCGKNVLLLFGVIPSGTLKCMIFSSELNMEGERVHIANCAPPWFPIQKHTVIERGRGGRMIVSLFMFGWTADEQTQKKL